MLELVIPAREMYDERNNEFIYTNGCTLRLEHSLVSLSKWESKWNKPFLNEKGMSLEETIDYIKCMTLTQNVDPEMYRYLSNENLETVRKYIEAPMTATWFSDNKTNKKKSEAVTAEIIYYWMISLQIPFECQKWHLNRLLTLIQVCSIKNSPPKKMSKREILNNNRALNEARRASLGTSG